MTITAVVVVVLVIGLALWKVGASSNHEGEKPPGMPPEVAQDFQQRLGGATGPPPKGSVGGSQTSIPMGAPGHVPPGAPGTGPNGYIMPPPH